MIPYIVRRLLWVIVLLLVVSFITFIIFYTLPSADPAVLRAGRNPSPELVESIRQTLGLDKPWYVQYWKYMKGSSCTSTSATATRTTSPVRSQIFDRLPATISLAVGAVIVWLLIGIPIGIISAVKRGTWIDRPPMGARARRHLGAGLLARPRRRSTSSPNDIGKFPLLTGSGALPVERHTSRTPGRWSRR